MDWTDVAQDGDRWRPVVNVVMNLNLWVPSNAGNILNCCETISFSRKTLLHEINGIIIIIIIIILIVVVVVVVVVAVVVISLKI